MGFVVVHGACVRYPSTTCDLHVRRTRALMVAAVRDCLVVGHEPLIASIDLPDPDDRHVLAAAIRSRAQVIVTDNTKDFPADSWRNPPGTVTDVLHRLEQSGLHRTVALLRS